MFAMVQLSNNKLNKMLFSVMAYFSVKLVLGVILAE